MGQKEKLNMNFLIIGRGSIAIKHRANIKNFNHNAFFINDLMDGDSHTESEILDFFKKIINSYDAVIIANASHKHFIFAEIALKNKIKIYLEKPPCLLVNHLKNLISINSESTNMVAVGFQMRFSQALIQLKSLVEENKKNLYSFNLRVGQALDQWRDGGINKNSYYSNNNTGGGVMYELSHEIDLALWIFGNPINFQHKSMNLRHKELQINDFFTSIWEYEDIIGEVHMDMIDPVYTRSIEVIFSDYKLVWSIDNDSLIKKFNNKTLLVHENKDFLRQDLIKASIINFIRWVEGEEDWNGATLEESLPLLTFFERVENEK